MLSKILLQRIRVTQKQFIVCVSKQSLSNISGDYNNGPNNDDNSTKSDHDKKQQNSKLLQYVLPGLGAATIAAAIGFELFRRNDFFVIPEIYAATVKSFAGGRSKYNFIADVVEVCAPSVVFIEIKDTLRYDYFSKKPVTASNGSGFIVDSDGLILTNAHVVINKPHTAVQIRLANGKEYPGFVEDVDPTSDLATVRVKCKDLPIMKLGNSSDVRAGEWVVAMGSPLSLSNTVTCGVISSTQRPSEELGLRGRDINYIQTDAAITFGNSGGPLVNLDGEAIGINSMKVTAGISFAIPIDHAKVFLKKSAERRKSGGKDTPMRRYMGITMLTLTPDILLELHQRNHSIPDDLKHGVLVWKVILRSPAHIGGLVPGDIITRINGKEVRNAADIYDLLAENGKPLYMEIYRNQQKLSISVRPEDVLAMI